MIFHINFEYAILEYWNLGDLRRKTGKGEAKGSQRHLTFWDLHFTVEWMQRNAFSGVK